jgi:hypothetical protein
LQLSKIQEIKATHLPPAKDVNKMNEIEKLQYLGQVEQFKITFEGMENDFHKFLIENKDDLDQDTVM